MTTFAEKFAGKALALIEKFGRGVTLTRATVTHSATTLVASSTTTAYPCKCVMAAPAQDSFTKGEARVGLRTAYIAALAIDVTPQPGDVLTIGGVDWQVLDVEPTESGETSILFKLTVRK